MSTTVGNQQSALASEMASEPVAGSKQTDANQKWKRHPVDMRLTIPFLGSRFYFTFVAGREQRAPERRLEERKQYPVLTFGNLFFAFGLLTIITVFALAAFVAQSAIIEY